MTRPGWERRYITASTVEGPIEIEASVYGDLAVHRMINDPGWCFSYVPRGLRVSFGYRVFASEVAAMEMVETIYPFTNNWSTWFDPPIPEQLRLRVGEAHKEAEARGAFLSNLVAPTRHLV
jgi:hypothetical protein